MHQCISYMPTLLIMNQDTVLQIINNAMNNANVVLDRDWTQTPVEYRVQFVIIRFIVPVILNGLTYLSR
ncbi:hypothetical protein ACB092_06G070700 [Castanea dentata]